MSDKNNNYDGSRIKWIWGDPDLDYIDKDAKDIIKQKMNLGINPEHLGPDKENIGSVTICGTAGEMKVNSFSEMWKNLKQ